MKHNFILYVLAGVLGLAACSSETEHQADATETADTTQVPQQPRTDLNAVSYEEQLEGGGMQFNVRTTGLGEQRSLAITVNRDEQETTRIDEPIEGSVTKSLVTDLNQNKKPELLVFVQGGGSGSYGQVYGYEFEREYWGQLTMPALTPELQQDYMGHDEFNVINNKLVRTFPIYLDTDANCCPSGGVHTVVYTLDKGLNLLVEKAN